jgi:hypothetical protein
MKILIAWGKRGRQGKRFNWTLPNEPLVFPHNTHRNCGDCGCGKSFIGIRSRKGTSHAEVIESPLTEQQICLKSAEFYPWNDGRNKEVVEETLLRIQEIPVGTILTTKFEKGMVRLFPEKEEVHPWI